MVSGSICVLMSSGHNLSYIYLLLVKYSHLTLLVRNPIGRTGMAGRGLLGKWGPNHAADPIVTR